MRQTISIFSSVIIFFVGVMFSTAYAEDNKSLSSFENAQLSLKLFPRSSEQMAGFFEARGFPRSMIEELAGYCFFTVVIKNKMNDKLWLDLREWNFSTQQKRFTRIPRSKWSPVWAKLNIPLAAQSTFRWTLLPETLRFYANETEGGNIVLQKTTRPFVLRARFGIGDENNLMMATVKNLRCADAERTTE